MNLRSAAYRHAWGRACDYPNIAPAVSRQLRTAKEILKRFTGGRRGILLADDVRLGKTAVAAIVALIYACKRRKVLVLAPNELVANKWVRDLETHCAVFETVAGQLHPNKVKIRRGASHVYDGSIVVGTHHKASRRTHMACDLLIVDEAHRSKGEDSEFRQYLENNIENIGQILCLTATPFQSIRMSLAKSCN